MIDSQLYTSVSVPRLPLLGESDLLVAIGSCFATEMGVWLQRQGRCVVVNPLGTLFNPMSIGKAMGRALRGEAPRREMFVERGGRWVSFDCHSDVFGDSREELAQRLARGQRVLREGLARARMVVVTFGTALLFRWGDEVVANCHRRPAREFVEEMATVAEIVEEWRGLLVALRGVNDAVEVVLTVSPVRHFLSGAHRNAVSKAILLEAVQRIVREESRCHYFPAFEIVLDELRDYRFFSSDLAHPSPTAVDIVVSRFRSAVGGISVGERVEIESGEARFEPMLSSPRLVSAIKVDLLPTCATTSGVQCVGGAFASQLAVMLRQCGLYATHVLARDASVSVYSIVCVEAGDCSTQEGILLEQLHGVILVSPARAASTAAGTSAYAHASALLAAQRIADANPALSYFPSYEILHDELRDYRFYAADLLSLSPEAWRIIVGRLVRGMIDADGLKILQRYESLQQTLAHRPMNPAAPVYLALLQRLREEADAIAPWLHPEVRAKMVF